MGTFGFWAQTTDIIPRTTMEAVRIKCQGDVDPTETASSSGTVVPGIFRGPCYMPGDDSNSSGMLVAPGILRKPIFSASLAQVSIGSFGAQ